MERHTCNRCFRHFPNGRALCGHMRSHVADSGDSADEEHDGAGDKGSAAPIYVLRENPRKSFRLVDPEFSSSIAAANAASSLAQDGESEAESPRAAAAPKRRRSKRRRRAVWTPEPASSVSDATPEEDVAISLMMLSRDAWASKPEEQRSDGSDGAEDDRIAVGSDRPSNRRQRRSRYRCETCEKSFRSYQALGGHRASHKKLKIQIDGSELAETNAGLRGAGSSKVHECPVCLRVFPSGQALGGHKRSHFAAAAAIGGVGTTAARSKYDVSLIDLNMPAPIDEESAEVSVVSDEEFVHPTNIGFRPTH